MSDQTVNTYDPLDNSNHTEYHISGLDPTNSPHAFTVHLNKKFADKVEAISISDEQQASAAEDLCEMFLDHMYAEVSFSGDSYLIRKIKVSNQETGLHYHGEEDSTITYGCKNVDTTKQCVEILSVFTRWVEYAKNLLSKHKTPPTESETIREEWERHNEEFSYEPPKDKPEMWDGEQHNELIDRVISRRTERFVCDQCSAGPFRSIKKARSHVNSNHQSALIKQARQKADWDEQDSDQSGQSEDENDGDEEVSIEQRKEKNKQLDDWEE